MESKIWTILDKTDVICLLKGLSKQITLSMTDIIPRPYGVINNNTWIWSDDSLQSEEDIKVLYKLYIQLQRLIKKG